MPKERADSTVVIKYETAKFLQELSARGVFELPLLLCWEALFVDMAE
jgi:hypothetical protein